MAKPASYKPLLFTTTMRNPERIKSFLKIFKEYDGEILTEELIDKILGDIIKEGLYKPSNLTRPQENEIQQRNMLSEDILKEILANNPQNHKEAGFPKGWASRFDTIFKIAKELGFVYYKLGESIKFSKIGLELADTNHSEFEQQAFLNAFVKYQRNNPFRKVLNENVPLLLLLEVIIKLNRDRNFTAKGISRLELPLLLYWKDNNVSDLCSRIISLRKKYRFAPSTEVIVKICQQEIMKDKDRYRSINTITSDLPDEFIRKMRLTGLISLRGGGRFIDINQKEKEKVDYILKNFADYKKYSTEKDYFEYASKKDPKLFSISPPVSSSKDKEKHLLRWAIHYDWQDVRKELLKLKRGGLSKDEILRYLPSPCRLEFLTAIALKKDFHRFL